MDDALLRALQAQRRGAPPAISMAPTMGQSVDPNAGMAPGIAEAFNRVRDVAGKAVDYSPIAGIVKSIQENANRDRDYGMVLQGLGGKHLAPVGRQLMEAGLEAGKPFRPNAADTAYVNPDTNEIIANPHTQHQRDIKLSEFELQRRIEEDKARQARTRGAFDKEQQRIDKREQDLRHDATLRAIAAMNAAARSGGKGGTKPLSSTEMGKLQELNSSYGIIVSVMKTYKPEYAGGITGQFGGDAEKWAMSKMPEAVDLVKGSLGQDTKLSHERQGWWRAQEALDTLPERHKLFGAALTPGEQLSWAGASIQQGMSDADIRKHMQTRAEILQRHAKELYNAQIANQKHPEAVRKGLSNFKDTSLGALDTTESDTAPVEDHASGAAAELARRKAKRKG